jgi:hypothetical protein
VTAVGWGYGAAVRTGTPERQNPSSQAGSHAPQAAMNTRRSRTLRTGIDLGGTKRDVVHQIERGTGRHGTVDAGGPGPTRHVEYGPAEPDTAAGSAPLRLRRRVREPIRKALQGDSSGMRGAPRLWA